MRNGKSLNFYTIYPLPFFKYWSTLQSMNGKHRPYFSPGLIDDEPYVKRFEKPWGFELHFLPSDKPYMLKRMHINAGHRTSMHVHDAKQETYLLIKGKAKVIWEGSSGKLEEHDLKQSHGYTTQVGQRHRLVANGDCDIIAASTPEIGTSWRLEDDYDRPNETPEQRRAERGGK